MQQFQDELDQIRKILKTSSHGMSVTEIARMLNKNQHSVGRYLDILLVSGQVEMRTYGKAKVFSISSRVPLNTLMGRMNDLVLILDADNHVVQVNDQFLRILGKSRKDLVGRDIAFLPVPDRTAETIVSGIRGALESGPADQEIIPADKEARVYRQKIIPTVFEDGRSGTIVILEDITERKSAGLALRASEEQFRLMAENIQDGIAIYRNKKLKYMNRRVGEILGYSQDEFLRLSPLDFTAPEERPRLERLLAECSATENVPSEITFWVVRKDGARRYVSCRITTVREGNDTVMYTIVTDVTEWKHAQDALENQLLFLQHMIDTFPNPLFYLDTRGRYLGCNSAFLDLTGRNLADIAGKTDDEIAGFWNRELFGQFNRELSGQERIRQYSGDFQFPDGRRSPITIQKSAMTGIDGNPAGIIGIILFS